MAISCQFCSCFTAASFSIEGERFQFPVACFLWFSSEFMKPQTLPSYHIINFLIHLKTTLLCSRIMGHSGDDVRVIVPRELIASTTWTVLGWVTSLCPMSCRLGSFSRCCISQVFGFCEDPSHGLSQQREETDIVLN